VREEHGLPDGPAFPLVRAHLPHHAQPVSQPVVLLPICHYFTPVLGSLYQLLFSLPLLFISQKCSLRYFSCYIFALGMNKRTGACPSLQAPDHTLGPSSGRMCSHIFTIRRLWRRFHPERASAPERTGARSYARAWSSVWSCSGPSRSTSAASSTSRQTAARRAAGSIWT
jgi:hypothetical protein